MKTNTAKPEHFDEEAMLAIIDELNARRKLDEDVEFCAAVETQNGDTGAGSRVLTMLLAMEIATWVPELTKNEGAYPRCKDIGQYGRCELPEDHDEEHENEASVWPSNQLVVDWGPVADVLDWFENCGPSLRKPEECARRLRAALETVRASIAAPFSEGHGRLMRVPDHIISDADIERENAAASIAAPVAEPGPCLQCRNPAIPIQVGTPPPWCACKGTGKAAPVAKEGTP